MQAANAPADPSLQLTVCALGITVGRPLKKSSIVIGSHWQQRTTQGIANPNSFSIAGENSKLHPKIQNPSTGKAMSVKTSEENDKPKSGFRRFVSISDDGGKILGFLLQLLTISATAISFPVTWLKDQALYMPTMLRFGLISTALLASVVIALSAYRHRNRWSKWAALSLAALSGLVFAVGILLFWYGPPPLTWRLLNVRQEYKVPQDSFSLVDMPLALMRNELLANNDLSPGGTFYRTQVAAKRHGFNPVNSMAGFYAPLLLPGTMPSRVSLRDTAYLGPQNASIGVYVFVWTSDGGQVRATATPFGFESLNKSVDVKVSLERGQRAAMMVFIFPWDATAASNLPKRLEDAVILE
jgi:hypothetical protein